MRHKELFKTYIWLVETIYRFGPITFEELGRRWQLSVVSEGNSLARTTFNRHREEIEDIFGIRIVCDRSNGWRYSIENAGELEQYKVEDWMVNMLSLNNVLAENRSVGNRILLEYIPSEGVLLQRAIESMRHSKTLAIDYRKYQSEEVRHFEVEPYCVKLYNRRWYVLVRFPDTGAFRILSFDRIVALEEQSQKFHISSDFDAQAFFQDCFGIVRDTDVEVQRIVLRAYGKERYYLRDLPVHRTQELVEETDEYADYEVRLSPTGDFKRFLLSHGAWLQVISPQSLASEVAEMHALALRRYEKG